MQQFIRQYNEFETKTNAFILKVERDSMVAPRKFEKSKFLNFYVRIFIDINPALLSNFQNSYTLDDISFVKYELHPSYLEPIRTSSDNRNNFELKVWTYGFYPIKATIYLKMGSPLLLNGEVKFEVTDEERKINRGELD